MNILIYCFYLNFVQVVNLKESIDVKEDFQFYNEISKIRDKIELNFEKYQNQLKSCFINFIKNVKDLEKFRNELNAKISKNIDCNILDEIFSSIQTENMKTEKTKECNSITIFIQKYNKNTLPMKEKIVKLVILFIEDYKRIYKFIKKEVYKLLTQNKVDAKNYAEMMEKIVFKEYCFFIGFYDFQIEFLSKELEINAFNRINPIHELIIKNENKKSVYNYICVLLEILDIYDLPPCLTKIIYELKIRNTEIINYYHNNKKNCRIYDLFVNNIKTYDDNEIRCMINDFLQHSFLNSSVFTIDTSKPENKDEINIFKDFILKIQMNFKIFSEKVNELKNKIILELQNYSSEYYSKLDNKKDEQLINDKFATLENTLKKYYFMSFRYIEDLDSKLRKILQSLIIKIRDPTINNLLPKHQQIKFNHPKNLHYNICLKTGYQTFFHEILINKEYNKNYQTFLQLVDANDQSKLQNEIRDFCDIKKRFFNFRRKEDIIIQINTLFTDNKIKKECLDGFIELIAKYENEYNVKHLNIQKSNDKGKSPFNKELHNKMLNFIIEEKRYITKMKNVIKNEIKLIDIVEQNQIMANNKNEHFKVDATNNEYVKVVFDAVALVVVLGLIGIIIYKFRKKLYDICKIFNK